MAAVSFKVVILPQSKRKEGMYPVNIRMGWKSKYKFIPTDFYVSRYDLNKKLEIIYNCGGVWVLYAKYQDKGYTGTKTTHFTNSLGMESTRTHTYWTEKGRAFIHSLFNK